jgi:alanine dehydrogenase
MITGVPKKRKVGEYRVGITPERVGVLIKQSTGDGSRLSDHQYVAAGATIVSSLCANIGKFYSKASR